MLRVTTVKTNRRLRLILRGTLASPWVERLIEEWDDVRASTRCLAIVVDLRGVTLISQEGKEILLRMMRDGARFICRRVLNRHVLQRSTRKRGEPNPGLLLHVCLEAADRAITSHFPCKSKAPPMSAACG